MEQRVVELKCVHELNEDLFFCLFAQLYIWVLLSIVDTFDVF
jgi:hypothetical protein